MRSRIVSTIDLGFDNHSFRAVYEGPQPIMGKCNILRSSVKNFCNISHVNCMNLRRSHFCEGQLQSGGLVCKECGELCSLFVFGSVPRNNAPAISRSIIAINTISRVFIDISYPEWGERYRLSAYFPPHPFERNFCRATQEGSQVPAHLQAVGPHL